MSCQHAVLRIRPTRCSLLVLLVLSVLLSELGDTKIILSDGATYVGEVKHNTIPHGRGARLNRKSTISSVAGKSGRWSTVNSTVLASVSRDRCQVQRLH